MARPEVEESGCGCGGWRLAAAAGERREAERPTF